MQMFQSYIWDSIGAILKPRRKMTTIDITIIVVKTIWLMDFIYKTSPIFIIGFWKKSILQVILDTGMKNTWDRYFPYLLLW